MSDNSRPERTNLADWPDPATGTRAEDYHEDEDYTAPVKENDAAMIQFLSSRANKTQD